MESDFERRPEGDLEENPRESAHTFGDRPAPTTNTGKKKPHPGARAALHLGRTIVLLCSFAGATLGGVMLHANTPAFRRMAASIGNEIMGGIFEGKIVVTNVRSLRLGRYGSLAVDKAEILDPDGKPVIVAENVEGTIDLYRLIDSVTAGKGPVVDLSRSSFGKSEVILDVDPKTKTPKIALTFQPKKKPESSVSPPPTPDVGPPKEPTVIIPHALLKYAHVHGDIVPAAPGNLDAVGEDLDVSVLIENAEAHVKLLKGRTTLRSPRVPNQRCDVKGDAHASLDIALKTSTLSLSSDLDGACGGVPVVAKAQLNLPGELQATLDIASVEPSAMRAAFGDDMPFTKSAALHAQVHGQLASSLFIDAKGKVGETTIVTARGELDLREGHAFKVDVDASHVDATAFGAPAATDLSAKVHGEGVLGIGGGPMGSFKVTTAEGTAAGQKVPPTTIEGSFDPQIVKANINAKEPGVVANGNASLDRKTKVVTFDVQGRSDSLQALARAENRAHGSATARVRGTIDLDRKTIAATAVASGDGIGTTDGTATAKHVNMNGTISGSLDAPVVEVAFTGTDVAVKTNTDKGSSPLTYPQAKGSARIAIGGGAAPRILDATLDLDAPTGAREGVAASAKGIHVGPDGNVEARGLRITGLGEPLELDARFGRDSWSIRAKSRGVDLHRVATLTGIKQLVMAPEGTRAELDVDLSQTATGADGHLDVVVRSEKGAVGDGALIAEAHAKVERGKLTGNAKVTAEGFGQVEITRAELEIPSGRLDGRSLARTTGVVEMRGAVDLSRGAALLLGEYVERASGVASFEARIERGDPNGLPAIRGTVKTEGLEVAILRGDPPIDSQLISGVDVMAHVAWDGRTEDAELSVLSWDKHGLLGTAGAKSRVPVVAWATGAKKITGQTLGALEIDGRVSLPARELTELPAFMRFFDLQGKIDGHMHVTGTLAHPKLTVTGKANGIAETRAAAAGSRAQPSQPTFEPLDGAFEARWDGEHASVTLAVDERRRQTTSKRKPGVPLPPQRRGSGAPRPTLALGGRARNTPGHLRTIVLLTDVKMTDILNGTPVRELPWRASAEVEVENLMLAALPIPGSAPTQGALTGRVRVKDINHDPSFEGSAHIDNFGVSGARVKNVDVTVGGRDRSLFGQVTFDAGDDKGKATVQVASQSLRIQKLHADWDSTLPTRIDYAIMNGRLALLAPIVKKSIPEIDGRVNGVGSISLEATSQVFEGGLAIQEGRLYVTQLGEEISNLTATARFERSGTWRIEDAKGKMGSGEFRGSASGRMKGLDFVDAEATLIVAKDAIPISAEGATFAEATGEVKISAKRSGDARSTLLSKVSVPRADIQLPDRSTQQLEQLEPDPTIRVGVRRKDGQLDRSAVRKGRGGTGTSDSTIKGKEPGALVARIDVDLGENIHLEGRGLDVTLTGKTSVGISDEVVMTGRIDLRSGTIIVHGRRFTVETGAVTFLEGGEIGNPIIVASAYWDAPDRTRVWVEFVGPLKTGKLTLRSEPPYSKNEILSVLLFGRPDPNMAAPGQGNTQGAPGSGATAVGSGFVAGDLNRVLSELDENLDIETDTLSGNRTRTKLGRSFFDRRLKVQVGYAPGRTYREPDSTYVFVNWQFIPKWSLQATRGDRGTSILDILFQHRY